MTRRLAAGGAAAMRAGGASQPAAAGGGSLVAWGDNESGQLGDGTRTSRDVPVSIKLPAGIKIASVRGSTSKGKVMAWGLGSDGELGNGTAASSDTPVRTALPKGTKVTSLFAGCAHTLALTSTGKVLAWGSDKAGQLGNGHIATSDVPVRVKLPAGLAAIALGTGPDADFSFAITR